MSENVILQLRDIFFRAFVIGGVIYGLILGLYYALQGVWIHLLVDQLHLLDRHSLEIIVVSWYAAVEFFLYFILLVPTLALHWTLKIMRQK